MSIREVWLGRGVSESEARAGENALMVRIYCESIVSGSVKMGSRIPPMSDEEEGLASFIAHRLEWLVESVGILSDPSRDGSPFHDMIVGLQLEKKEKPTPERFARVCTLLRQMILTGCLEDSIDWCFGSSFPAGMKLLSRVRGRRADLYFDSDEQELMVSAFQGLLESFRKMSACSGMTSAVGNGLCRYLRREQFFGTAWSFLFDGDRCRALFNPGNINKLRDLLSFYFGTKVPNGVHANASPELSALVEDNKALLQTCRILVQRRGFQCFFDPIAFEEEFRLILMQAHVADIGKDIVEGMTRLKASVDSSSTMPYEEEMLWRASRIKIQRARMKVSDLFVFESEGASCIRNEEIRSLKTFFEDSERNLLQGVEWGSSSLDDAAIQDTYARLFGRRKDALPAVANDEPQDRSRGSEDAVQDEDSCKMLETNVEWLIRHSDIRRFKIKDDGTHVIVTDTEISDGKKRSYRLKKTKPQGKGNRKLEVVARLMFSFENSSGEGEFVMPEENEDAPWHYKMNDRGDFERFWRVETEGRTDEFGKDLPGRRIRAKPDLSKMS